MKPAFKNSDSDVKMIKKLCYFETLYEDRVKVDIYIYINRKRD